MPEYLAPGVYVEETSFRAKSIEGTSTSTTAFVGAANSGPTAGAPELLTSFNDFQRVYGGLDDLQVDNAGGRRVNHLAHAVRSYFDNGGSRMYVMRTPGTGAARATAPFAVGDGGDAAASARFSARFEGSGGNGTILARERTVAATNLMLHRAPVGTLLRGGGTPALPAQIEGDSAGPFVLTDGGTLNLTVSGNDESVTFSAESAQVTADNGLPDPVPFNLPANAADRVLTVTIGDGEPQVIDLGDQELPRAVVLLRINELLRGGYATVDVGNELIIGSDVHGLAGGVSVAANPLLGFDNPQQFVPDPAQNNVNDIRAVTIDEVRAVLEAADIGVTASPSVANGRLLLQTTGTGAAATLTIRDVAGTVHQALGLAVPGAPATGNDGAPDPRLFIKTVAVAGERGTWSMADDTTLMPGEGPGDEATDAWQALSLSLEASDGAGRNTSRDELGFDRRHPQFVGNVFPETPERRAEALENGFFLEVGASVSGFDLYTGLVGGLAPEAARSFVLSSGVDGGAPSVADYEAALEELARVEDVSIVAAPGYTAYWSQQAADRTLVRGIQEELIGHAERRRAYRIAVLDTPAGFMPTEARDWRSSIDSTRVALYYPWAVVANPLARPDDTAQPHELALPPSGFVCGIYARNDVNRGVHKAPANEVVRGALRFERPISFGQQEMLNPIGVNCLRFFPGRGNRVWGARTASSDPEFKYVSDRRYFNYLEASIDGSTQFAVFEPNGDKLWRNVRDMVSEFLYNEWRNNALFGKSPEEAFFVRCDRSTMTQNDLDNGRLICLIGVALLKPAEFVIFRIGQKTADARG